MRFLTGAHCIVVAILLLGNAASARDNFLLFGPVAPISFPIDNAHIGLSLASFMELKTSPHFSFNPIASFSYVSFDDFTRADRQNPYEDVHATNFWMGLDLHYYPAPFGKGAKPFLLAGIGYNKLNIKCKGYGGWLTGWSGRLLEEDGLMFSLGGGLKFGDRWLVIARVQRLMSSSHTVEIPILLGLRV